MLISYFIIYRADSFQAADRLGNVRRDDLSVSVEAHTEDIDDLFLGGIFLQTLRDSRKTFVALYQAVKTGGAGGDDQRLTVYLMNDKILVQLHKTTYLPTDIQ